MTSRALVRLAQALTASLVLGCATSHDMILSKGPPRELQVETPPGPYRKVQRVIDGDTIVVERYGTVRMLGVDTPELHHPTKPVGYCALEAAEAVLNLLDKHSVRLSMAGPTRDRYGRILAFVWRRGLVQERLLRSGLARVYDTAHPRREAFKVLEAEAKAAKRGVWGAGTCRPVPVDGT
jgi:endonuclease YncB( thermonuclease family)